MTPAEIAQKLPGDVALQKVCEQIGRVPECFLGLDPHRMLAGQKLGRSMRAARASFVSELSNFKLCAGCVHLFVIYCMYSVGVNVACSVAV